MLPTEKERWRGLPVSSSIYYNQINRFIHDENTAEELNEILNFVFLYCGCSR